MYFFFFYKFLVKILMYLFDVKFNNWHKIFIFWKNYVLIYFVLEMRLIIFKIRFSKLYLLMNW